MIDKQHKDGLYVIRTGPDSFAVELHHEGKWMRFGDSTEWPTPRLGGMNGPYQPEDLLKIPVWISVEEGLPHGEDVLMCNDKKVVLGRLSVEFVYREGITHWMPLLELPKA